MSSAVSPDPTAPPTGSGWKWGICVLLLLATTLNYMDRQALAQTSVSISKDFGLSQFEYSRLLAAFNVGFGVGALVFGWLVDKVSLRWLYAGLVLAWSAVGFTTGFVAAFIPLLVCRFFLGVFESGNWPCGIMTVKRVLKPEERALGSGMFASGTALGAIIIPLVVLACDTYSDPNDKRSWQIPFRLVGLIGMVWVFVWLWTVRSDHIAPLPPAADERDEGSYWEIWRNRRFYVLVVVVLALNTPWRTMGEWLPKYLDKRGYARETIQLYSSAYFFAADIGSITAGLITLRLVRGGWRIFSSRLFSMALCVGLVTITIAVVLLPTGWWLFAALLLVGFGALGSFSSYFAFTQDVSSKHQGKVTGTLGLINALGMAGLVLLQGKIIDLTGSFTLAIGLTGLAPLLALAALYFFWENPRQ
jgi:ACS family hexuronate transporter-like MFS transporter